MANVIPGTTAPTVTNPFAFGSFSWGLDANGFLVGTGGTAGGSVPYTPSIGGTGWSLGNGSLTGFYTVRGPFVVFNTVLVFGSTTVAGAGGLTLSFPVASGGPDTHCQVRSVDISAGTIYFNTGYLASSTTVAPIVLGASGTIASFYTATAPFAWAVGDSVTLLGYYLAN